LRQLKIGLARISAIAPDACRGATVRTLRQLLVNGVILVMNQPPASQTGDGLRARSSTGADT